MRIFCLCLLILLGVSPRGLKGCAEAAKKFEHVHPKKNNKINKSSYAPAAKRLMDSHMADTIKYRLDQPKKNIVMPNSNNMNINPKQRIKNGNPFAKSQDDLWLDAEKGW